MLHWEWILKRHGFKDIELHARNVLTIPGSVGNIIIYLFIFVLGGGGLHCRLMAMALFDFGKSYQNQGRAENSIDCAKISYCIYGSRIKLWDPSWELWKSDHLRYIYLTEQQTNTLLYKLQGATFRVLIVSRRILSSAPSSGTTSMVLHPVIGTLASKFYVDKHFSFKTKALMRRSQNSKQGLSPYLAPSCFAEYLHKCDLPHIGPAITIVSVGF